MSYSAPMVVPAESLEAQLSNLHVFEFNGASFAFNPISVRLVKLEAEEAAFLSTCRAPSNHEITSSPELEQELLVMKQLRSKGLFEKRLAHPNPNIDRVEFMVNATQECNLACPYCFVGEGRFGYGETRMRMLSPILAHALIESLPRLLPWAREICIHFYGGEPLLNIPAMHAAVDAASPWRDRFSFAVTTNGTICSEEAFSLLSEGRFSVILSIDGPEPVHDLVRKTVKGKPTHATVMTFLERLKKEKLVVRGSSVVRNGWSLNEACGYLRTLNLDAIKAQAVRLPTGNPLALTEDERRQYYKHLGDIANEVIDSIRRREPPKDDRFSHRVLQILRGTRRTAFCGAGRSIFGLAADGTVYPCVLLAGSQDMLLGRIDGDGADNWAEKGLQWAESRELRDECKKCWALPLCGGGCPAMLSVCGDDECEMVRANCEMALGIYGSFLDNLSDLLILAGVL